MTGTPGTEPSACHSPLLTVTGPVSQELGRRTVRLNPSLSMEQISTWNRSPLPGGSSLGPLKVSYKTPTSELRRHRVHGHFLRNCHFTNPVEEHHVGPPPRTVIQESQGYYNSKVPSVLNRNTGNIIKVWIYKSVHSLTKSPPPLCTPDCYTPPPTGTPDR